MSKAGHSTLWTIHFFEKGHAMEKVFVYGTLKSGERACSLMERCGEFQCLAKTKGTLIDLGGFPGFIGTGESFVHGEVWSINQEGFSWLDCYEGEGFLYQRRKIEVESETEGQQVVWGYEYLRDYSPSQKIESGMWSSKKRVDTV